MDKKIVISAVNIVNGGALTILREFVDTLNIKNKFEIILCLHSENLINKSSNKIKVMCFPMAKKNYLLRLFYEYVYFYFLSKKIKPDIWISLHDITPNVIAKKKFVYCHNPSPFYKFGSSKVSLQKKFILFYFFYSFFYKLNIKKNTNVLVQQNWIKNEFENRYRINNIIIVRPDTSLRKDFKNFNISEKKIKTFFYPSFPRFFKNFEVIIKALDGVIKEYEGRFEIIFTMSGNENKYSKYIHSISNKNYIKFIGQQSHDMVFDIYNKTDYLIFTSNLETWGLPLSEFQYTGRLYDEMHGDGVESTTKSE